MTRRLRDARGVTQGFGVADDLEGDVGRDTGHGDGGMSGGLAHDAELWLRLRAGGYQGPDWDRFVHELLAYGLASMSALIGSGIIFTESALLGRAVGESPGGLSKQDIDDLAGEVVLRGFRLFFERGLVKGEWSPSGGRTLVQYFGMPAYVSSPTCSVAGNEPPANGRPSTFSMTWV